MRRSRKIFVHAVLFLAVVLGSRSTAFAGLRWDNTTLEKPATANSEKIEADFAFTNDGKRDVMILNLKPSCGCTVAKLEKTNYKPGEQGQVKVIFTLTGVAGVQQTSVEVSSAAEVEQTTVLHLQTTVPEFLTVTPRSLTWSVSEPLEPKESLLIPPENSGMQVIKIRGELSLFEAKVHRDDKDGRQYLIVKPRTLTVGQEIAFLDIQASGGPVRTKSIIFRVR